MAFHSSQNNRNNQLSHGGVQDSMTAYEGIWSSTREGWYSGSVSGGASVLLAAPAYLWHLYVEYLWNYDRHAWILSASATFKLLAIIAIMPFIILALLVCLNPFLHFLVSCFSRQT